MADGTLSYPATIAIPDNVTVVGGTVRVDVPFMTEYPLVPLGAIRPRGRNRAMVSFWDGRQVVVQEIQTGKTWDEMIEIIVDDIPSDYQIITTDLTNYDPNIHTIQLTHDDGIV